MDDYHAAELWLPEHGSSARASVAADSRTCRSGIVEEC